MSKTIILALALVAMAAPVYSATNWTTALPAALERAAKEKKLVLVYFSGSDWSSASISLKKDVFDKTEFLAYAKDKFILVNIDLRVKNFTPELRKINKAICEQYAIYTVPCVFVMNTEGIVVGGFLDTKDSIVAVQDILNLGIANAVKLHGAVGDAVVVKGLVKAKALYAAYQMVPATLQFSNTKLLDEIKALDTEDSLGIVKVAAGKAAREAEHKRVMSELHEISNDRKAIIKLASKELERDKLDDELRKELSVLKFAMMMLSAESLEDIAAAKLFALSEAKTAPNPVKEAARVERIFADPAKLLQAMHKESALYESWTTDLPAALEQAEKEQKLVLVNFNGSDWCAPCIKLKKLFLNTDEFSAYAKEKFILVDIDVPRWKKMAPELLKSNKTLVKQYAVTGFPSIFVMNTDGVVVGGFVGGSQSMPAVQENLNEAILNAAKFQVALKQASTLSGAEKKKALNAAYKMLPAEFLVNNANLMPETKTPDTATRVSVSKSDSAEAAK